MDDYLSIAGESSGLYKEKGSKFIAIASSVDNESQIQEQLQRIRKEHHNARHHCYAYVLGKEGSIYRSSDDGEPRHSAGDPILNQIRSAGLSDILLIVVRYFGGTKLGKSGLIHAYKSAAREAISGATIIRKVKRGHLCVRCDYTSLNEVMHIIQQHTPENIEETYEKDCRICCMLPESQIDGVAGLLGKVHGVMEIETALPG